MPRDYQKRKNVKRFPLRPKAVIFDMDGVIVDSMPYHFLAWYEALRPLGIRVTCFDIYMREGERWEKSLRDFLRTAGLSPSKKLLLKTFRRRQRIFRSYFKRLIFSGAEEFLECLNQQGYLLGLVTGTPIAEVKRILPQRIRRMFGIIVSGDRVTNGKPHPEPYFKAAQGLKARPAECIVIENAPLGIESAKRAGMFCVALATSLPEDYLKRADVVVRRLEDIFSLLEPSCRNISSRPFAA